MMAAMMLTTMTPRTEKTTTTEMIEARPRQGAPPGRFAGIRFRLLAWFILLLALASATSVIVVREILLNRLDERIDRELVQESQELRVLAQGIDPETGRPFGGRVRQIFETFLERNVPSRNEALLTFVDGEPFLRSQNTLPYRLDQDPELVARWGSLERTERGIVGSPAGGVEFLAVPLNRSGEAHGVFVVAIFRDIERDETDTAIAGAATIGLVVLLVGSVLAWRLADRILSPVRRVTQAARSISETDLTRRIEVEGKDEISQLASTFNEMLDRIEEAFRTQKSFIDDASHELRTPITIIRGHLETLESDPEARARTVALLLDELNRMSRLVEDLLFLARSERPDLLELEVVDVTSLTTEVHAKAAALAERDWVLAETGKGRIVADRQRLTQALVQLAQNASQHTEEGDLIEFGSAVANGTARFWVRDTGPGIAPAEQARIFERFARGRFKGKRSGGAGIGLAIVQAIAKAHRGRVEVDSAPGEGATFGLVIPVDQPKEDPNVVIVR
jgi:signal transduction histidine kinase